MTTKTKSDSLSNFCKGLKAHQNFLLASHVKPEGDAVACLLAMDSLLKRLGKKTMIVCEDPFPERLCSVLPAKKWNQAKDVKVGKFFDALVVADCPTLERIGKVTQFNQAGTKVFNIDHHHTNRLFGDFNYVETKAAACGEVVYEIFRHLKLPLTKDEAAALYIAITTDTGSFKYSSTTVRTHQVAADLISKGIDIEKINDNLYASYSLHKMKLYSRLMAKIQTAYQGDVAWVGMSHEDLIHSGASYEDAEGFIDFLKYIREVKFAFFLSEAEEPGAIRVSIRSKGKYDASKVAGHFDGGGHQKASGCTIKGKLEEASADLLHQIGKQLDRKV